MGFKLATDKMYVVGAGAHAPYGFPTGAGLKSIIREICYPKNHPSSLRVKFKDDARYLVNFLPQEYSSYWARTYDHNKNLNQILDELLNDFVIDFLDSSESTIDSFLSQVPKWSLLGKLLITYTLRDYEKREPLRRLEDNWIELFLQRHLTSPKPESLSDFPIVITFNYDRLLEESILRRLGSSFGLSAFEADKVLETLPIYHVYGKIGDSRFDDKKSNEPGHILSDSQNIKIVGEERIKTPISEIIQKNIASIRKMYVLGFGYDKLNCNIIFNEAFKATAQGLEVYTTNIGLEFKSSVMMVNFFEKECRHCDKIRHVGFKPDDSFKRFQEKEDYNCVDLLKYFLD